MTARRAFALGLAGLAVSLHPAATAADSAWRALPLITAGKVDANWVQVGWGGFSVDDGALRTDCDARGLGLLVYRKERLGDCQIRVVFKTETARSNSGVFVRMTDGILNRVGRPGAAFDRSSGKISKESMDQMKESADREEGPWFAVHQGYEVQIMDSGDARHRTGAIYSFNGSTAEHRPGEWRTMIITLAGERIAVDLDGQRVSNFDPANADIPPRTKWPEPKREMKRPSAGYIGLQNHDPGNLVWFKEVAVRPLPASETKRQGGLNRRAGRAGRNRPPPPRSSRPSCSNQGHPHHNLDSRFAGPRER